MNKSLEIWKLLREYIDKNTTWYLKEKTHIETVEGQPLYDIENSLKALDILVKRKVDIGNLMFWLNQKSAYGGLHNYNNDYDLKDNRRLTEEEFGLLKEVLL